MARRSANRYFTRFSLRTLLVFVTITILVIGWYSSQYRQWSLEVEACRSLKTHQEAVVFCGRSSSGAPHQLPSLEFRNILHGRIYNPIESVFIADATIDSKAWADLRNCRSLETLKIQDCTISESESGFAGLSHSVSMLDIRSRTLSREHLQQIATLQGLTHLWLSPQGGIDTGELREFLSKLRKLPSLRDFSLNKVDVSTDAMSAIAELRNLETLSLTDCKVGLGSSSIRRLLKLKKMDLSNTNCDNETVRRINATNCPVLEVLILNNCEIDDGALQHISRLRALKELHVANTRISKSGPVFLLKLPKLTMVDISNTQADCSTFAGRPTINCIGEQWSH
jgi:Leucine-rich repeat (LRR) protein